MVHFLLLGLIARLAAKFNVPTDPDALVPPSVKLRADALTVLYLLLVIALSALTYRWIETPGRNLFNKLAKSTRKKPPVAPSTSPPAPTPTSATLPH
jgi:peptidoglycan/LPS O-acetylase OafA/YrhL